MASAVAAISLCGESRWLWLRKDQRGEEAGTSWASVEEGQEKLRATGRYHRVWELGQPLPKMALDPLPRSTPALPAHCEGSGWDFLPPSMVSLQRTREETASAALRMQRVAV